MVDETVGTDVQDAPPAEEALAQQEGAEEVVEQERDYEQEASDLGWVASDQFKGDPDKWVEAEEFVTRGETFIPFLKADRKKLQGQLDKERGEFAKRLEKIERTSAVGVEALRKQHAKELSNINAQQRAAVHAGDLDKYDELKAQETELAKQAPESEPANDQEKYAETVDTFAKDNNWYGNDQEMTDYAEWWSVRNANRNDGISLADNLSQTKAAVEKQFPAKFKTNGKSANGHALVDSGSGFSAPRAGKTSSLSGIPKEDLDIGRRQVGEGLFKDIGEWAKEYKNA